MKWQTQGLEGNLRRMGYFQCSLREQRQIKEEFQKGSDNQGKCAGGK